MDRSCSGRRIDRHCDGSAGSGPPHDATGDRVHAGGAATVGHVPGHLGLEQAARNVDCTGDTAGREPGRFAHGDGQPVAWPRAGHGFDPDELAAGFGSQ
jgi:hypothetical protein